jgi:hypothetical protein
MDLSLEGRLATGRRRRTSGGSHDANSSPEDSDGAEKHERLLIGTK